MDTNNKQTHDEAKNNVNQTAFTSTMHRGVQPVQRPDTSRSDKSQAVSNLSMIDSTVLEKSWTIDDILNRYKFVGAYPVPTSLTSHAEIAALVIPQDLYANNPTTSGPFSSFRFWRGDISLRFQITASPTAQGCVAATFIPLTEPPAIRGDILPNFTSLSVNQTVYLFPNANSSAEMNITFNSPFSAIDVELQNTLLPFKSLGTLMLYVFNPIELSANSSDNISVSIFVTFGNNQFRVLRTVAPTPLLVRNTRKVVLQSKNKVSDKIIDTVVDSILPDNVIGDGLKTLGKFGTRLFGLPFDKPSMPDITPPVKLKGIAPMNYTRGPDYVDVLGLNPEHNPQASASTFGTSNDETSMDFLLNKMSYLGSFTVHTTASIGQVVASWPINPCPARISNFRLGGNYGEVPLLQYLSVPFQLWSGAISYRFQIVSTMMQTCKLYIACNYGEYVPLPTGNLDQITSQYGAFLEINQGSNIFDFTPEYLANTPYKYVPISNIPSEVDSLGFINVAVINPLVATNNAPPQIHINVFIAGSDTFNFTGLSAASPLLPVDYPMLAKNVKKIRYVQKLEDSDMEDIEVIEVPKNRRQIKLQSSQSQAQPLITPISEVDMVENKTEDVIAATQDMHKPVVETSQRHIDTICNLLKKYQMLGSFVVELPDNLNGINVEELDLRDLFGRTAYGQAVSPPSGIFPLPPLGNFTHFERLYRQFYGSLNFKIVLNNRLNQVDVYDAMNTVQVLYQPPYNNGTINHPSMIETIKNQILMGPTINNSYNGRTILQYPSLTKLPISYAAGIDKVLEFKVPYASRFLSTLKASAVTENALHTSELNDLGTLYIVTNHRTRTGETLLFNYDIFLSFGDETRMGTLYRVPQLFCNASYDTSGVLIGDAPPSHYDNNAPIANTLIRL
jgi:hypothetical protein